MLVTTHRSGVGAHAQIGVPIKALVSLHVIAQCWIRTWGACMYKQCMSTSRMKQRLLSLYEGGIYPWCRYQHHMFGVGHCDWLSHFSTRQTFLDSTVQADNTVPLPIDHKKYWNFFSSKSGGATLEIRCSLFLRGAEVRVVCVRVCVLSALSAYRTRLMILTYSC